MKRIYFSIMMLAMMVAALSFTACGGDDDDEINGNVSIVGVWECESAEDTWPGRPRSPDILMPISSRRTGPSYSHR